MTPQVGINRGYLFGVGEKPYKDHVYVAEPQHPFDPFANPKLRKAFDQSSVIISDLQDPALREQEVNDFFQTLPKLLERTLTQGDLCSLRKTLEPLLDQMPGLKTARGYDQLKSNITRGENDAAAVTALALFGILNTLRSNRHRTKELSSQQPSSTNTMMGALNRRADLLSKRIVPLLTQENEPKITEVFSILTEEPELLRATLFAFSSEEFGLLLSDANAFERGNYEDDSIPDMTKKKLMRVLFSNGNIDLEKLERSPAICKLGTLLDLPNLSGRIERFVASPERHLFLISSNTLSSWPRVDFPLTQLKIPLKPVGFFWTIRDGDGREGILMGSMHITAEKLVNFPRRITELFDDSDAIAVEIDVTREDVVRRMNEVSWEKEQAKEVDLLTTTEKEELLIYLKKLYPDLNPTPMNEFDEQTQFLLQALRTVARGSFAAEFSGQKDQATKQSFFSTGMEETLIKRAKERGIPIKDLETFDDHFIKFSSGSSSFLPSVRYESLKKMIEMSKWSLQDALAAYCDHTSSPKINSRDDLWEYLQKPPLQKWTDLMEIGDLDALEIKYLRDRDPVSQSNLVQRNRNMALAIDAFMKSGKKHFCIAGAMHMAGPSSIVTLLKQAGYSVERLIVEEPLGPVLDDDEKRTLIEDDEIESTLAADLHTTTSEEEINPFAPDPSSGRSYWQILSWPWKKFKRVARLNDPI